MRVATAHPRVTAVTSRTWGSRRHHPVARLGGGRSDTRRWPTPSSISYRPGALSWSTGCVWWGLSSPARRSWWLERRRRRRRGPGRRGVTALTAVVAGRRRRYVLLNAPVAAVDRIAEVVPDWRPPPWYRSPSTGGWRSTRWSTPTTCGTSSRAGGGGRQGILVLGSSSSSRDQPADQGRAGHLDDRAAEGPDTTHPRPRPSGDGGGGGHRRRGGAGGDALAEAGSKHGGGRPGDRWCRRTNRPGAWRTCRPTSGRRWSGPSSADSLPPGTGPGRCQRGDGTRGIGGAPLVAAAACGRLRPRRAGRLPIDLADDGCARSDRRCR